MSVDEIFKDRKKFSEQVKVWICDDNFNKRIKVLKLFQ